MSHKLQNWTDMGGYADYIWPAYGIATLIIVALWLITWRQSRLAAHTLANLNPAGELEE